MKIIVQDRLTLPLHLLLHAQDIFAENSPARTTTTQASWTDEDGRYLGNPEDIYLRGDHVVAFEFNRGYAYPDRELGTSFWKAAPLSDAQPLNAYSLNKICRESRRVYPESVTIGNTYGIITRDIGRLISVTADRVISQKELLGQAPPQGRTAREAYPKENAP